MAKSEYDKPWTTPTIKALIRECIRLNSSGKGNQGATKINLIVNMTRNAKRKYGREKVDPLLNTEPAKWHRSVKGMSEYLSKTSVKTSDDNEPIPGSRDVNFFLFCSCCLDCIPLLYVAYIVVVACIFLSPLYPSKQKCWKQS